MNEAPALARLGDHVAHLGDEAVAAGRREQQPTLGLRRDQRDDASVGVDIDDQPQRFAEPAPAGQLVGADGEKAPVARRDQQLVGRLGVRGKGQLVAFLELERSEEHTSELQSLMRISYAVFCLKKKKKTQQ